MSQTQQREYRVEKPCDGEVKTFTTHDDAKNGREIHARFCDECKCEDLEIETVEPESDESEGSEQEPAQTEVFESSAAPSQERKEKLSVEQMHEMNLQNGSNLGMADPLVTLPDWMKSEIDHGRETSVDLNKRGTQVIANALNLVVKAVPEISAEETEYEYCRYRATVETPDGHIFNAVGDAHIDESGKNKWDLERLAETRAKKRCIKWSTGGGIQAFVDQPQDTDE